MTNLPDFSPGKFLQFVADNVDHNACTLDGHGTFHRMGIIACTSPISDAKMPISKKEIPLEEIVELGHFDQFPKIIWSLNTRGLQQSKRRVSGKTGIAFVHLNPSDETCINSTLHFVCSQSSKYGVTPVIIFDHPLFQKATNIVSYCTSTDPLRKIVLRLCPFHTEMRCIAHIMSGSLLQEAIETVHAPNAVTYMMIGKSIDSALHAMLLSKTLNIDMPVLEDGIDSKADQEENKTDAEADFQDLYVPTKETYIYENCIKKISSRVELCK
ncbi:LOW QUALITY PROTEIN: hypothetical protein MAR_004658 [Mya arenaria]|uniref:Uncharacterized protein n=1 Tax=Mya arenaria TaxID=6604 RepID=A0ABY7EX75_MYAAR|nr:LOW QUALITY PROTEIN: hypothetical protein MAR_004658 [Mya arenaria]